MGIFGNISDADLWRTIDTAPGFCPPGGTLIWSRGRDRDDLNQAIRSRFLGLGFAELSYDERDQGSRPALGAMRYDGPAAALDIDSILFTFWR